MDSHTAIYYVVSRLTDFEPEQPGYPAALKLPPGCVGTFLVFDNHAAALAWADGDAGAIRPLRAPVRP